MDASILLLFNNAHTPLLDGVMWLATSTLIWVPFFCVLLYVLAQERKTSIVSFLLGCGLVILLSDQISASIIKPMVARLRPSHEDGLSELLHYVNHYQGGLYGFVSSHAANTFAFAIFSSMCFRHWGYTLLVFLWAAFSCYTRLYLGVHYPSDILCGAILGLVIGGDVYFVYLLLLRLFRFSPRFVQVIPPPQPSLSLRSVELLWGGFLLTILFMFLAAFRFRMFF